MYLYKGNYSATKRNEAVMSAKSTTTWINLKNIILSERSKSQKTIFHCLFNSYQFHLYEMPITVKPIERGSGSPVARVWGAEGSGVTPMGTGYIWGNIY